MPEMKTQIKNPDWRPEGTPTEKAALKRVYDSISDEPTQVAPITLNQNIKNSGGMYVEKSEQKAPDLAPFVPLERRPTEELKVSAATLGVKTDKKRLTRGELIHLIRKKMDEIEIVEDDAD